MPAFASLPAQSIDNLMTFLTRPEAAPVGSAALGPPALREPDYPEDVTPPPSRYKTGYGNESYVITPPWSTLTAYDLNTGKIKWQAPYGDLPQAGPIDQVKGDRLRGNVFPKSGFVITAGGLVLFAGNDSRLYVLDKETGKPIFSKDLPNGSLGVPAVYEVNGREYILLAVSGGNPYPAGAYVPPGGVIPPAISKSYIAFALPAGEK
jgi:quinoprotein glucose dehydrogenase